MWPLENKKKKQREKLSLFAMLGIGAASVLAAFFLSERYNGPQQRGDFQKSAGGAPWGFRKVAFVTIAVIVLMLIVQLSGLGNYFKTSLFEPLEKQTILDVGEAEIGKPYCLGGTGPNCYDCSGYTGYVMETAVGIDLPRRSRDQATVGKPIALEDASVGDLVFFYTNPSAPNTVSHVGILADEEGNFLNANSWRQQIMYDSINVAYWRDRFAGARELQIDGRERTPVNILPEEEVDDTPPDWGEELPPSEVEDERLERDIAITEELPIEEAPQVGAEVIEEEIEIEEGPLPEETVEPEVEDFPDVNSDHPRYEEIMYLKRNGIVSGYGDGTFKPNGKITRAELLKILMNSEDIAVRGESDLEDVDDHWVEPYVATAQKLGFVGGYPDGTFRPDNQVSLFEALKITFNILHVQVPRSIDSLPYTNLDPNAEYAPYLYKMQRENYLNLPEASIDPNAKILRQDMATLVYRINN